MSTPCVTYWFRPADDAHQPTLEWFRQVGAAIGSAASAVDWGVAEPGERPWVEVHTGSVTGHPAFPGAVTVEGVRFVTAHAPTLDAIAQRLRDLGASRGIAVTRDDAVAARRLAPFAFLYEGVLVRHGWWGEANERWLESVTGLRTMCTRDEAEDAWIESAFGSPRAASVLAEFYARRRATSPGG